MMLKNYNKPSLEGRVYAITFLLLFFVFCTLFVTTNNTYTVVKKGEVYVDHYWETERKLDTNTVLDVERGYVLYVNQKNDTNSVRKDVFLYKAEKIK